MNSKLHPTRKLVILTTHFGLNFSGGSNATHEIFVNLQHKFDEVIVICRESGRHLFENPVIVHYDNFLNAIWKINAIKDHNTIFYGDFYNAIYFVWLKKRFYFTYHDNWPEMKNNSLGDFLRSPFYLSVYRSIFRNAEKVVVVSEFKKNYVSKFSNNVHLIRNGFNTSIDTKMDDNQEEDKILMVGNIESRKYKIALTVFRELNKAFSGQVHIYGNIIDNDLAEKLKSFDFVRIMGFEDKIPYSSYDFLLHTSFIENLPMSICESLFHHLPVVAFDVGGIREIVNSTNGKLIKPYEIDAMITAIHELLSGNFQLSFMENNLEDFTWEKAVDEYMNILDLK